MPPAPVSRRQLIAIGSGAAVCFCALVRRVSAVFSGAATLPASHALAAVCAASGCSREIGGACLRALPAGERSHRQLARLIIADFSAGAVDCRSPDAIRRALREQGRADFAGGRIVSIDGWMLSLTETRVYALAELIANAALS
jgi:hypothetical protein